MARGEPLFSSVFASQPPAFYYTLLPPYLIAHSVVSLRLSVLVLGVAGLVAVFIAGRMLAGTVAGFVALVLTATSPLYFHESAILQADGPAVALSVIAFALALVAVRHDGQAVGTTKLTREVGSRPMGESRTGCCGRVRPGARDRHQAARAALVTISLRADARTCCPLT